MRLYCNKSIEQHEDFHSRLYDDFVNDYRENEEYPFMKYPEDYHGESIMKLCCSQHSKVIDGVETISDHQQKKITESWARFFQEKKGLPLKEVQVCTRMNQSVFDALCNQKSIESLRIKYFTGKNVGEIRKLTNLKKLFIESASSLESIEPIAELSNLEVLILGNTKKITDYNALGQLKKVKVFSICSYQTHENIMRMADDSFMYDMSSLKYVDMCDVRVENQVFLTPENVKYMEFAVFYR